MKVHMTEKALDAIMPTSDPKRRTRYEVQDSKVEGLVVRVNVRKDGTIGLAFWWRRHGSTVHLGKRCEAFNLAAAREAARRENVKLDSGTVEVPKKDVPTLQEAWEAFRETDVVGYVKPSTLKRYDFTTKLWGRLRERRIDRIRKEDVKRMHAQLGEKPRSANLALWLLKRTWENAADLEQVSGRNPCSGVKKYPKRKRRRVLSRDELVRFLAELEKERQVYQDALLVALLTGARKGNVVSMRWADVDLDRRVWTIPETKNGEPVLIQLTDRLVARLRARRNGSEYVFPPQREDSTTPHLADIRSPFHRVCRRAGIEDVTPHDLRRTFATIAMKAGISPRVLADSLGHHDLQSQDSYTWADEEDVRRAVEVVDGMVTSPEK